MVRFRQIKALQKFCSVHAAFHNNFNQNCHLIRRETYNAKLSAAQAEWKMPAASAWLTLPALPLAETD